MEFNINDEIHALTWNEPFGSLMLAGKQETRKNPTNVRGWVLICNAQKPYGFEKLRDISGLAQMKRIREALFNNGKSYQNGVALSIGYLCGCREMTIEDEDITFVKYRNPWIEYNKNGDAVEKRLYVWEFKNMIAIEPLQIKGKQGWSILTPEQKKSIKSLAALNKAI